MTRLAFCLLAGLLCTVPATRAEQDILADPDRTFTRVGQPMPDFAVTTLDGARVNLAALRGKVVLVNFWATWCHACVYEMPLLEREIWKKHQGADFVMVAIAREETEKEIAAFRKTHDYTFPMAADPERAIYNLVAAEGIPRNYVVGADGRILYQSVGFAPDEFGRMQTILRKALAAVQKEGRP